MVGDGEVDMRLVDLAGSLKLVGWLVWAVLWLVLRERGKESKTDFSQTKRVVCFLPTFIWLAATTM